MSPVGYSHDLAVRAEVQGHGNASAPTWVKRTDKNQEATEILEKPHLHDNRLADPWKTNRAFTRGVSYIDVTVILYPESNCTGKPDPKGAIGCDGYCWPVGHPPKSVFLEAQYNAEFSPKGKPGETRQERLYDDVHRKGPQVEFFGGQRSDGNGDEEFLCTPDKVLTRATIPQGHNSSCFNLDEKPGGAFSGMVARHVEICPWEAERYRRALWWTLPENTRDEKYDWASMQFEEYPQWAKDALDGEPREDTLPEWKFPHPNGWEVANSPGNPWSNPSSAAANGGRPGAPPLPGQIPGAASQNVPLLGKRPMGLVTDTSDPDSSFPIK